MVSYNNNKVLFKIANICALIGYMFNIISMFIRDSRGDVAANIVHGVFHIFFILFLFYVEADQEAVLGKAVPFLYSFIGRGIFYIWISWATFQVHLISLIGSIVTCVIGIVYVSLFLHKTVQPTTFQLRIAIGVVVTLLLTIAIIVTVIIININSKSNRLYKEEIRYAYPQVPDPPSWYNEDAYYGYPSYSSRGPRRTAPRTRFNNHY